MKKIRVGIIGCGTIFPMHAQSLVNIKNVEIVAVCDIKEKRARDKAAAYLCDYYTDYRKMLKSASLDAVHICTPHYLHLPMVLESAKNKINIVCEKPMALNPKDAARQIKCAKDNHVLFMVISQNRFNPSSRLVKKRIGDGSLGTLKGGKITLTYHKPDSYYKKSDWKGRKKLEGGGVVIDQAIHYLDIMRWLVPSPIDYVESNVTNRCHSFIDVEDEATGIIKFKNGFIACFYLINYYSYDADPQIELDCEKAKVNIVKDSARIGYLSGREEFAAPDDDEYIDYGDGVKDYWGYCHFTQIKDFYDAFNGRKSLEIKPEDSLVTQKLVWAIYESSRLKKKIYF